MARPILTWLVVVALLDGVEEVEEGLLGYLEGCSGASRGRRMRWRGRTFQLGVGMRQRDALGELVGSRCEHEDNNVGELAPAGQAEQN